MKKVSFFINGGAGRVIASMPALRKYARLNPESDFKIVMPAWEELLYGDSDLQPRVFNVNQKGIFESTLRHSEIINPEPYFNYEYINQQASLAEAFDKIINNTNDHSDLDYKTLTVTDNEREYLRNLFDEIRKKSSKKKFIVVQPFGSTASVVNNRIVDTSNRSLKHTIYLDIVKKLSQDYHLVFFGPQHIAVPGDTYTHKFYEHKPDLRFYATAICESDYFLGVDSVGQHIARAFDKPGLVIMGGTFERNVSYPDYFKFYRNSAKPTYSPIRLSEIECSFADKLNEKTMSFNDEDVANIVKIVQKDLG